MNPRLKTVLTFSSFYDPQLIFTSEGSRFSPQEDLLLQACL